MRIANPMRFVVAAMATAMVAACGSGDSADSGDASGAGDPQVGGSAVFVVHAEPRSLDPALISNSTSTQTLAGNSLYGALLRTDPEFDVEYGLAESLESADGGTTWQLTLRDGLTFSDGSPLDAAAVQANWQRLKDPAVGSAATAFAVLVDTMTADGQVLEFTLVRPMNQFASTIARTQMNWIAKPEALEAGNQAFDQNPIGAGPFVLRSWQRNGEMVLVRNENYWDAPRPYLDELILTPNGDGSQRLSTVISGGADAATMSAPDLAAQAEDAGLQVTEDPAPDQITYLFNGRLAPFDDVRARRAVAMGVDLEAVNAAAYSGQATVPEAIFGEGSDFNGDARYPGFDPEAAQELFDELADEGAPVQFTITAVQTTESRRVSEAIQAQLSQYDNVQVELEVLDFPAFLDKQRNQSFQFIPGGLLVDPVSFFQTLHSEARGNRGGVSSPELDAALEAILTATDSNTRTEAYQQFSEAYVELMPAFSYINLNSAIVHGDHVGGVEFYANGALRADTLWVTE